MSEGGPKWPVSAFGRAKKWRSRVREAKREAGRKREGEQHNGARTPYIGLPDARRPDAADGQRKQKPEWRTTGGCRADTIRREENGEAGTAADKDTAKHSNPYNITTDIRNWDNDCRHYFHIFFGGQRKSRVWGVRVPLRA